MAHKHKQSRNTRAHAEALARRNVPVDELGRVRSSIFGMDRALTRAVRELRAKLSGHTSARSRYMPHFGAKQERKLIAARVAAVAKQARLWERSPSVGWAVWQPNDPSDRSAPFGWRSV
jgi:hypothetical protein